MTLTERVARAMYERSRERWPDMPSWETAKAERWRSDVCAEHWTDEAEAAIREVLAALRTYYETDCGDTYHAEQCLDAFERERLPGKRASTTAHGDET